MNAKGIFIAPVLLATVFASCKSETNPPAATPKAPPVAEQLGRQVIQAIKTNDPALLRKITPKQLSSELAAEIEKTREVSLGDFGELVGDMEADGIAVDKIRFSHVDTSGDPKIPGMRSVVGTADVYFSTPAGKRYYVYVSWSNTGKGPALLGVSRWYKAAAETGLKQKDRPDVH